MKTIQTTLLAFSIFTLAACGGGSDYKGPIKLEFKPQKDATYTMNYDLGAKLAADLVVKEIMIGEFTLGVGFDAKLDSAKSTKNEHTLDLLFSRLKIYSKLPTMGENSLDTDYLRYLWLLEKVITNEDIAKQVEELKLAADELAKLHATMTVGTNGHASAFGILDSEVEIEENLTDSFMLQSVVNFGFIKYPEGELMLEDTWDEENPFLTSFFSQFMPNFVVNSHYTLDRIKDNVAYISMKSDEVEFGDMASDSTWGTLKLVGDAEGEYEITLEDGMTRMGSMNINVSLKFHQEDFDIDISIPTALTIVYKFSAIKKD